MSEFAVRRVVVACDAVSENRAGLEAAARLAKAWNALLHAVFLQDQDLLNLAALPFVRQTGTGGAEELDEAAMMRQLEANAGRARATLETAARQHAVAPSFVVVRGRPALDALAVEDRDLLVIVGRSRPFAGKFRLASRWLTAALEAHLPVLLLRDHAEWVNGVVCVLQSTAPSSWRALRAAAAIALATGRPLVVRIVDNAMPTAAVRGCLSEIAPDLVDKVRIEAVSSERLVEGDKSLLVLDAALDVNEPAALRQRVESSSADMLFVR